MLVVVIAPHPISLTLVSLSHTHSCALPPRVVGVASERGLPRAGAAAQEARAPCSTSASAHAFAPASTCAFARPTPPGSWFRPTRQQAASESASNGIGRLDITSRACGCVCGALCCCSSHGGLCCDAGAIPQQFRTQLPPRLLHRGDADAGRRRRGCGEAGVG